MANRKQRRTHADVQRIHTQTEINRRLCRSHTLAHYLSAELLTMPVNRLPLWLPAVMDYIADDIGDIQRLLNKPSRTA
ncbi:derepression protein [Salmonella enterica]|nr:derepression protein [Salmonella enterica]EAS0814369.1 derepression protein [Salmonella enterica]EAS2181201.1 derepression protein [Salmonella enterica]EAZ2185227.1 derepression protein [Salmonella enterica]EDC2192121.1 derepression protein [Salmonella enterica]